ncbi:MAG: helix-turn-helix domain-containing protein [Rhodospirillales bacterium]|jgi:excisionase family DNA binding protein|nr:helix-turn-helix domain-containing protein [Rhodospirillales bacterium]
MSASNSTTRSLPTLYTVTEAADHLKVSTKTVRRWIDAGSLSVHRLGRSIRISETDLNRLLSQNR